MRRHSLPSLLPLPLSHLCNSSLFLTLSPSLLFLYVSLSYLWSFSLSLIPPLFLHIFPLPSPISHLLSLTLSIPHSFLSFPSMPILCLKIFPLYPKRYICKFCKYLIRLDAKHYLELRLIKLVPSTFCKHISSFN